MVESAQITEPKFHDLDKTSFEPIKDKLQNTLFQKNRARFFKLFKEKVTVSDENRCVALFRGASEVPLYSSDVCYPEYQEAFFYYLFGVIDMDCYGFIDFNKEKVIVFAPLLSNLYKIWMTVSTMEEYSAKYDLEFRNVSELQEFMATECPNATTTVYVNQGVNSDSGLVTLIPD